MQLRSETKHKVMEKQTFQSQDMQLEILLSSSVSGSRVKNISRMTFFSVSKYPSSRYLRGFDCFDRPLSPSSVDTDLLTQKLAALPKDSSPLYNKARLANEN